MYGQARHTESTIKFTAWPGAYPPRSIIQEKSFKYEKDVQHVDVHVEVEQFVVFTMDGLYTENPGEIFGHPVGEETFYRFSSCIKML